MKNPTSFGRLGPMLELPMVVKRQGWNTRGSQPWHEAAGVELEATTSCDCVVNFSSSGHRRLWDFPWLSAGFLSIRGLDLCGIVRLLLENRCQVEKYADIYTSRVLRAQQSARGLSPGPHRTAERSNFLASTPFTIFRPPLQSKPKFWGLLCEDSHILRQNTWN